MLSWESGLAEWGCGGSGKAAIGGEILAGQHTDKLVAVNIVITTN